MWSRAEGHFGPSHAPRQHAKLVLAVLLVLMLSSYMSFWVVQHPRPKLQHRTRTPLLTGSPQAEQQAAHPMPHGDISDSLQLKLNPMFWVEYAEQQAKNHGLQISEACNSQVGRGLLQSFAEATQVVCGGKPDEESRVECMALNAGGSKGVACVSINMTLNSKSFMGSGPAEGAFGHDPYLPECQQGSVQLACELNHTSAFWKSNSEAQVPSCFTKAYAEVDATTLEEACSSASTVQHPVILVSRNDMTNPFHHAQTIVHVFATLAALSINNRTLDQAQVVITDHYAAGPFLPIWQRLSYPYEVMLLKDAAPPGASPLCFKQSIQAAYLGIPNGFLGESVKSEFKCTSTALLAVAYWLRYMFLATISLPEHRKIGVTAAQQAERIIGLQNGHKRLTVLFSSRSWFERAMQAGGGLNGWQQQRVIDPAKESQMVQAMQQAVLNWNMRACVPPVFGWWQRRVDRPPQTNCKNTNVSFDFQVAELSLLPLYPGQISILAQTAVLVAAHGAALTNMVFMQPLRGAVVEIYVQGHDYYLNQANMLGHKHIKSSADAANLARAVTEALDHVASKY